MNSNVIFFKTQVFCIKFLSRELLNRERNSHVKSHEYRSSRKFLVLNNDMNEWDESSDPLNNGPSRLISRQHGQSSFL